MFNTLIIISISVADPNVYLGFKFFHPGSRIKKAPDLGSLCCRKNYPAIRDV
jgi:hypothetical protein